MIERKYIIALLAFFVTLASAQNGGEDSRQIYINAYAELAMKEMRRSGIPASITLAQGCLESGNGKSSLAVEGNNHFGIKCHDWEGKKIHHDDDKKNECFRKYKTPQESYIDHTTFLTSKSRYAFLFEYETDDYKQWAKGLKKAGYATSNTYAEKLIRIIEESELYKYDQMVLSGGAIDIGSTPMAEAMLGREILIRNRIEYIVVQAGDTPESLRDELDLYKNEIYKYNDLEKGTDIDEGQVIYLQPKRRKADKDSKTHIVKEGETMYDISQLYGITMKQLARKNQMNEGDYLAEGTEIFLRKKRRDPILKIEPLEEETEEEMIFKFDN